MSAEKKLVLNPQDHEHFLEHGYVVVHGAVPPEVASAAVAALEAGKFKGKPGYADYQPVHHEAVSACVTDRMLDAIEELYGPEYPFKRSRGGSDMPRPHQPEAAWNPPTAHVDDSYPSIMPNGWALGSFTFLTRVKPQGGSFIAFPGSPLRFRQAMAKSFQCAKGVASVPEYSGPPLEFLAQPGDVLLFNQLLGHCGSPNISDPTTRHALLARWHPFRRIVPGKKAFEQMSTIEKAYSARYLNHRFRLGLPILEVTKNPRTAMALREGFAGCPSVQVCALLQFEGRANLLYVDRSCPAVIRRLTSENLVDWQEAEPPRVRAGNVRALALHQYTGEAILTVSTEDNSVTLLSTVDFDHWTQMDRVEGWETATPFYVYPQYPSKVASAQTLYFIQPSSPSQVFCRWSDKWEGVSSATANSLALQAPEGSRIQDLTVAPKFADSHCAFVVDLQLPSAAEGETQPYYTLPKDIAVSSEPLQPLPYSCPGTPRHLRVYHRARNYWLVSYVRTQNGQDHFFWGAIDWEASPLTLREFHDPESLEEALCIVGMI